MSYLVLARKYRPRTFQEVLGQDVVTATLAGAIQEGRVGHAYLFTGPRGTGKTTSARIFAKALNCEQGPTVDPCENCERCRAADAGTEIDLIEIDAASNTGIDNVRELRDQAIYVPLRARFKIYLIDEVHMLTKGAFNALLKTLEEPPPHVKFLFATTEPQKIPDTILSRCQVLKLIPLDEEHIRTCLDLILQKEGISAEVGVSAEIARRARGGMRDALSLTDQLLALVGSEPKLSDLERLASEGSRHTLDALTAALIASDRVALFRALPATEGAEVELVAALLEHWRAALVASLLGADAAVLTRSPSERSALASRAMEIGVPRLELWLGEFLHLRERMRLLPEHARLLLEVTLLDLASGEAGIPLAALADRLSALEARLGSPAALSPQEVSSRQAREGRTTAPAPPPAADPPPAAISRTRPRTNSTADTWNAFLVELTARTGTLASVLKRCGMLRELGAGKAVIRLAELTSDERTLVEDPRNEALCSKMFSAVAGEEVRVELQDSARARPGIQDAFTREVSDLFEGRIED